jgi:uncharacterized RDD family membrane protein YckC
MTTPAATTLRSPEGVELRLPTATASDRLVALAIDLGLLLVLLLVVALLLGWWLGLAGVMLAMFVLRHGYFVWFETRGNGSTPGKRRFHLRVVRADGGPLTTEILLARNLTREVELFLPLLVLANPEVLFADHAGLLRLLASVWVVLLLLFPLTNPQRLRLGDLLAGTRVVLAPPVALARDLADRQGKSVAAKAAEAAPGHGEFEFTSAQLGIYGEHELGVLEEVLRKARHEDSDAALQAVAEAIARKIGFVDRAALHGRWGRFLRAFYAAQRQHLEQRLLLGKRRLRKAGGPDVPDGRTRPGPRG